MQSVTIETKLNHTKLIVDLITFRTDYILQGEYRDLLDYDWFPIMRHDEQEIGLDDIPKGCILLTADYGIWAGIKRIEANHETTRHSEVTGRNESIQDSVA